MILDAFRLEGKAALVTGASAGLGAAVATALAEAGADVACHGNSRSPEATCEAVGRAGRRALAVVGDLSDKDTPRQLVEQTLREFGRLDILVNNAGIIRRSPAVDFTEQDWNDVLRVNLTSPFFLTQAAARWWLKGGGREKATPNDRLKIVNIASLLSFQGGILVASYAAAKHGIAGITKALANEWSKERINVNAIAPGYIATENTRPLREDANRNAAILARIPQGDWGQPDQIAGTALYLASPDADYVNGAILNVDGGWLAR